MRFITLTFCFVFNLLLQAQDPQFTQHFSTGIYNNPAFTGIAGKARLNAAYRNQWPKIAGNYQTSFLSFDISKEKLPIDIGLFSVYDRAYILNAAYSGKKLSIGYSYDYTVSKLTNQTGGSHEITVNWTFGKLNQKRPGIGFISSLF